MIGHCFATLLAILSLLLVAAQSVPLNWTQPPPCIPAHGSPLNATDAFISDAVMKLSLEELLPEAGSLNQSVSSMICGYHTTTFQLSTAALPMVLIACKHLPGYIYYKAPILLHIIFLMTENIAPSSIDWTNVCFAGGLGSVCGGHVSLVSTLHSA